MDQSVLFHHPRHKPLLTTYVFMHEIMSCPEILTQLLTKMIIYFLYNGVIDKDTADGNFGYS